jgi:peptidoglycan/LPS O-acetylase OafA/YrhL
MPAVATAEPTVQTRLAYLDGLRGVAILLVVGFHYLYLFPLHASELCGYRAFESPLFKHGNFGVMLFFAISGFVISGTLYGSDNIATFASRRLSRLFPTMLACCLVTCLVSPAGRSEGRRLFGTLVPSLTFLDPRIFNHLFNTDIFRWADPAYWSLFTEVRFYAIASLLFYASKERFYRNFAMASALIGSMFPLSIIINSQELRSFFNFVFIANQLPWFTFGVGCYYLYHAQRARGVTLTAISLVSLLLYTGATAARPYMVFDAGAMVLAAVLIYGTVLASLYIPIFTRLLSWAPLTAVGVASYSLYLLHQELGQSLIASLAPHLGAYHPLAAPVLVTAGLIALSRVIYTGYESPSNRKLNEFFKRFTSPRKA